MPTDSDVPKAIVMFSSGVGSWAAARRYADEHGTAGMVLLFAESTTLYGPRVTAEDLQKAIDACIGATHYDTEHELERLLNSF